MFVAPFIAMLAAAVPVESTISPEPSSWILAAIGLGLIQIGWLARKLLGPKNRGSDSD